MDKPVLVTIPQETVNDETVRILSWQHPSGSHVEAGQILCEVETSKAVMEIEAPVAGHLFYRASVGDEIPIGETICQIAAPGTVAQWSDISSPSPIAHFAEHVAQAARQTSASSEPVKEEFVSSESAGDNAPPARLSPLARKVAEEYGITADSFPRGMLVRHDDVLRKAGRLPVQSQPSLEKPVPQTSPVRNSPVAGAAFEWKSLPRRKTVEGKLLAAGQLHSVRSSVTVTADVQNLRSKLTRHWKSGLGITALVIYEVSRLLQKYPEFNAVYDPGRVAIYSQVNIGWAIDNGLGLMVPVLTQANCKSTAEIVALMSAQYTQYMQGALTPGDFLAGTFTVSDLSSEGVSHFQPLISQGQSAILGVGSDTDFAGSERLSLTLSFDHQVTEGRRAAQFLKELSRRLQAHNSGDEAPQLQKQEVATPTLTSFSNFNLSTKSLQNVPQIGMEMQVASSLPESGDFWEHEYYSSRFTDAEIAAAVVKADPKIHFAQCLSAKLALKKCSSTYAGLEPNEIEIRQDALGNFALFQLAPSGAVLLPYGLSFASANDIACAIVIAFPPRVGNNNEELAAVLPDEHEQPTVVTEAKDIEAELLGVFTSILKFPCDLDTCRQNTPQWDSLKHVELMLSLEDCFRIRFSESAMTTLDSVKGILSYIREEHAA